MTRPASHARFDAPVARRAILVMLGLLLATLPFRTRIAAAAELERVQPQQAGFEATRLGGISNVLKDNVEQRRIAGGVAIVLRQGKVAYFEAVGHSDAEAKTPMQRNTIFRIASMTKPVTSVAVMILRDEGQLRLSDPVSKFIPEFAAPQVVAAAGDGDDDARSHRLIPAKREITIRDLLTHTSGLTYGFFGQEPQQTMYKAAGVADGLVETSVSTAENARRIAGLPLMHQPGEAWQYGLSIDVLGRVVEVASGQSLDEFFRGRIFEPLGMRDTHFALPADKRERLSALYRPVEDKTIRRVGEGPQKLGALAWSATFPLESPKRNFAGGAGLVSTAEDYAKFLLMLAQGGELGGRRLLKESTVEEMTSNQIGDLDILFAVHGQKFGYGFGIAREDLPTGAPAGTYSWGGLFHTFFWVDPRHEIIGIVMTQLYPFDHSTLWTDFQSTVYEALAADTDTSQRLGPQPGDVYREYATHNGGNRDWRVTDPQATASGAQQFLPNPVLSISIGDLEGAVRAEALLDRWGGHVGTSSKRIRFNGNEWITVSELSTTDGSAELYYSQDNPIVEIPLAHLKAGVNQFEATCSALEGHNWGQWGLYSLFLRVYYDPEKTGAPTSRIVSPQPGEVLAENPRIVVEAAGQSDVTRVDVLAWYEGHDENGDGRFTDWHGAHFQPVRGEAAELAGHVGTDLERPFELTWDTRWVPDQPPRSIKLVARVQDRGGLWSVSDAVEGLSLERSGSRVVLYRSRDVPQQFGVRVGQRKQCKVVIPDDADVASAVQAVLALRTWHGWDGHHEPLAFNGERFKIEGMNHHYDDDLLTVPAATLKQGENVFEISSNTEHHMLEVLWPGPALIVRFRR